MGGPPHGLVTKLAPAAAANVEATDPPTLKPETTEDIAEGDIVNTDLILARERGIKAQDDVIQKMQGQGASSPAR